MRSSPSVLGAYWAVAAPLASLFAMGCTAPSADGPDAEAIAQTATAVVVVERTTGPGDSVHGDDVIARFVRVRQGVVDDQTLRMAGIAEDLPPLGTCSNLVDEVPAASRTRTVELLDIGPVHLSDPHDPQARSTLLLPRTLPDPAGFVSGVIYAARANEAFTAGSQLDLHASGGPDLVDGFAATVNAPHELDDVRVDVASEGLDVSWNAGGAATATSTDPNENDARDVVYLEVMTSSANLVTRCTTSDSGHALVPASALAPSDVGRTEDGQLVVHRLHRENFSAKGFPSGEIRFDVARVVPFRR